MINSLQKYVFIKLYLESIYLEGFSIVYWIFVSSTESGYVSLCKSIY